MENINVSRIIAGLQGQNLYTGIKTAETNIAGSNTGFSAPQSNAQEIIREIQLNTITTHQQLEMNYLASQERSAYIKMLLNLPQSLAELMLQLQRNRIARGSLMNNLQFMQIFNDTEEIKQLLQQTTRNNQSVQLQQLQQQMDLIFSGLIRLNDVASIIRANSRAAMTQLIAVMTNASKQGIDNGQILETMNLLNSCVSMLDDNNPQATLKSLMLLYLPWLPLPQGVGFELEVGAPPDESEGSDSVITVLIQTKNYGNVKGSLTLTTSNSIDVLILCSEEFPKELLHKRLTEEMKNNSVHTNIDIEVLITKQEEADEHQAKVNLSAANELNPYLLLMAHSFIRHTIIIDNNCTVNAQPAA